MAGDALDLGAWTPALIGRECRPAYRDYKRRLDDHYTRYFATHPDKRGGHPRQAIDLDAALPDGWGTRLRGLVRPGDLHRHHLSGQSSQILALGLLGTARCRDASLTWLFEELCPPLPGSGEITPSSEFEYALEPHVLDEAPHVTAVDFFVEGRDLVLCTEAKWAEEGIGSCGCPGAARASSNCAEKVLSRHRYWEAARDMIGLSDREVGVPCAVSMSYQAVRNVAAAAALAGQRHAAFGLLYDDRNPYFAGCGEWPGWPAMLEKALNDRGIVRFASASWQRLVTSLNLDDATRDWAVEKHQIPV